MSEEIDIQELRRTASAGLGWSSVAKIIRTGAVSVSAVVYAALLLPGEFGVISLALVFFALLLALQELGASTYLVFASELSKRAAATLFWFNALIAVVASAVFWAGASLLVSLFDEPQLAPIIPAIALAHLITALGIMHRAQMQKRMSFFALARIEVCAVAIGVGAGIAMALSGAGIWGFVTQSLLLAVITSAGYWIFSGWRPGVSFETTEIVRAIRYSGYLTGSNLLNFLGRNSDDMLIGRYMTTGDLGLYNNAYRIMAFPSIIIGHSVCYAILPVLSSLKNRNGDFSNVFIESAQTVAFFCFPMTVGIYVVADDFVRVIFGEAWGTSATLLKILAPVGLVQSIGVLNGVIYQAKGRPDLLLKWGLVTTPALIAFFVVGLTWGTVGVASAYCLGYLLVIAYPSFWIPFRLIGLSVPRFLLALRQPFLCSLGMGIVVALAQQLFLADETAVARLAASVILGVVVYAVLSLALNSVKFRQVVRLQLLPPN